MKIGILTGGGDCPGLNAVIRSIVKLAVQDKNEVIGFRDGWKGVLEGKYEILNRARVTGIIHLGGTILGTSRTNLHKVPDGFEKATAELKKAGIDALVAIGGEDTLSIARDLHENWFPNVIGCPKTIDNDLDGTDYTFGFDTAVTIATEALDRLHSTAESHSRVMVLEVMGRDTGWIAVHCGVPSGADVIIIPEFPMTIEEIVKIIKFRHKELDKHYSIVVIAEGVSKQMLLGLPENAEIKDDEPVGVDPFGHKQYGGISHWLAQQISKNIDNIETRAIVLGYIQRGGTPTPRDRFLATMFGIEAYKQIQQGNFGTMMALKGTKIEPIPLKDATAKVKKVPKELYDNVKSFFG